MSGLRVFNQANVSILHSKILGRVDLFFNDSKPVEVTRLTPGHIDHWEFTRPKANTFHLVFDDAEIESWLVDIGDKGNVLIKDCVLSGLVLSPQGISGTISGLNPGLFSSWSLHENNDVDCAIKLSLINTRIQSWLLHFSNQARLTIYNSNLKHIQFSGYADLSLRSVYVRGLTGWDTVGKIDFDGSSITQGIEFSNAILTLTGNVSISSDCYVSEWQNSTIIRDFPVVLKKDFDTPASQMPIEITLPNGRKLDQTTDDNGRTLFQCTFTDSTYQDTCQLQVTTGSKEITHSVGFLESTPVTISLLRANTSSDTLFVATAGALPSLDPYNVELRDNGSVFPNVYEPLFLVNILSPSPAVPLIATEVPSLDNGLVVLNEDGSCDITLPIRTGVLFHDGTPLRPADVGYSLKLSLLLATKDTLSPTLE